MPEPLLRARGIRKRFPGVDALKGIDFDLLPGEVHALVGENGAGKSTFVNILTGLQVRDAGSLEILGRPAAFDSPRDARLAGIHVIHQELSFVPQLDVATNLALGSLPLRPGLLGRLFGLLDRDEMRRRAARALAAAGTAVGPGALAGSLSVAQAQQLEIARALDGDFRIILFDEPTSSLGPGERDELFAHIRRLRAAGIGILYISHRLEEVLDLSDRVTVLKDGAVVASGPTASFDIDGIVRLMTGRAVEATAAPPVAGGEVVLEVRGLSSPPAVRHADLVLRRGEIVGLAGLVGAGRTELAHCLYGARPFTAGEIRYLGRPFRPESPAEALAAGIGYATEDRKSAGIFHLLSTEANIAIGAFSRPAIARKVAHPLRGIDRRRLRGLAAGLVAQLQVRPGGLSTRVGTMSGGNQQKVVLARLIASRPGVLILDEPTRGIDVGAKAQIWQLIRELAGQGVAVLAISSDIPELIGNVERVLVMRRGAIAAELPGVGLCEEQVMRHAV
jgi:ABC-type sugar transport system ATPase subunit